MDKKAFFFIDDVIWVLRDITREKPKSIYDNGFMKMLKKAHDDNGLTVQLNLFYRTDFFYGSDEFTLADVTDAYKNEFEEASSWLKFAFHAKQEFPDYPYVNANYEDVKKDFNLIVNEIKRFAGEKSLTDVVVGHWLPLSKEGCKALSDCGIRVVSCTNGEKKEYNGDANSLPYGHAARLLQNRKPETMVFTRKTKDVAITNSICAYNHISEEDYNRTLLTDEAVYDAQTNISFKRLCTYLCLNLYEMDSMEKTIEKIKDAEFLGIGNHEQYFYKDYFAYQPDYGEKIYVMSKKLKEHGYSFVTGNEVARK